MGVSRRAVVFALAFVGVTAGAISRAEQAPARPTLASLTWLAGSWAGTTGGVEMEEQWTAPKGNSMIGMHRDVAKGRTMLRVSSFEGEVK